jgi:glucosylceramidase
MLFDYANSLDTATRLGISERKNQSDRIFGLNTYDSLIKYLQLIGNRQIGHLQRSLNHSARSLHVLWDHKKCMQLRLEYLNRMGLIEKHDYFSDFYLKLENDFLVLRKMLFKYTVNEDYNLLKKIMESLIEIKKLESEIMEELLKIIQEKIVYLSANNKIIMMGKISKGIQWIATTADKQWFEEPPFSQTDSGAPNLIVTGETHQNWLGFDGCFNELGWKVLSRLNLVKREGIVRELFQPGFELQFNFCRVPIGANDYAESWYSLNETDADYEMRDFSIQRDHQYLIPYIRQAKSYCPDLKLFASPWSPPTWMKHPPVYNHGRLKWEDKYLKAYALYLLKFVEAYRQEGIEIQQLHVQNEPVSDQKFPSCIWTGAQLRDFIRDYLGPLFEKNRSATEIWLGTLNGPEIDERFLYTTYNDYANLVLHDEKARRFIRGVGYQWRGKYALQQTRMGWPEIPLVQTENECGDGENTWNYAWYVFDLLRHYLTNDVIAYVYWNMVLAPGGGKHLGVAAEFSDYCKPPNSSCNL